MNTLKEQAQLTQDKLDGLEIELRYINDSVLVNMKGSYFNFEKYIYRRKLREPRVVWLNEYLDDSFIYSRGHNTQKDAEAHADNSCTNQVRFIEDLDWRGGEENE